MSQSTSTFERKLQLNADELNAFLDGAFPAVARPPIGKVVSVELDHVRMSLEPRPEMTRPGGIISGPTLMSLIDGSAYAVVLAHIGRVEMAVTYNLNVTFLRACRFETVIADARLLRLGRRLATVDVRLWQTSEDRLVAQSTIGYSLP
ncbi:MAG TPA: PaaI family thioesterase [Steroidobacteraceae bacterium]